MILRFKFILLVILLSNFTLKAQDITKEFNVILSKGDNVKIRKAQSYINQGNEILFANKKDSLHQEKLNYIDLSEYMIVGKKISRLLFESKDYYSTGFEMKLEVYNNYISRYLAREGVLYRNEVESLNDSLRYYLNKSESDKEKSKVTGKLKSGGEQIHQFNLDLQNALLAGEKAMVIIANDRVEIYEEEEGILAGESLKEKDSILFSIKEKDVAVNQQDTANVDIKPIVKSKNLTETKAVDKQIKDTIYIESKRIEERGKVEEGKPREDVYFTVQIIADRKPLGKERLTQVYSGNHKIIQNKGDGWYRYSFGKFYSISEAKKALVDSKTKGFVVAYKNKNRIPLSEAKAWLEGSE